MAYTFEDEDGHIGHGPTITGLRHMKNLVAQQSADSYPATKMLFEHGVTHKTMKLGVEASALALKSDDPNVSSSFSALSSAARRAKGIVILAG